LCSSTNEKSPFGINHWGFFSCLKLLRDQSPIVLLINIFNLESILPVPEPAGIKFIGAVPKKVINPPALITLVFTIGADPEYTILPIVLSTLVRISAAAPLNVIVPPADIAFSLAI
jgi:hypothetical protein